MCVCVPVILTTYYSIRFNLFIVLASKFHMKLEGMRNYISTLANYILIMLPKVRI